MGRVPPLTPWFRRLEGGGLVEGLALDLGEIGVGWRCRPFAGGWRPWRLA